MKTLATFLLVILSLTSNSQKSGEIRKWLRENSFNMSIQGHSLNGPIILVDPNSRTGYSNHPDPTGVLKEKNGIWSGILPDSMHISNTAFDWGKERWAMVLLPLPENRQERKELYGHELFHRVQPYLGLQMFNPANAHLEDMEARVLLRLEAEALKMALNSTFVGETRMHLCAALTFREKRHNLYEMARTEENQLELNEGLASYIGLIASGRKIRDNALQVQKNIELHISGDAYARTFAYFTIPAYGLLLGSSDWVERVNLETNLTDLMKTTVFGEYNPMPEKDLNRLLPYYKEQDIRTEEQERAKEKKESEKKYIEAFRNEPRLVIPLRKMKISFDPGKVTVIEGLGNIYTGARISDEWGSIEVKEEVLISENWTELVVYPSTGKSGPVITGKGWVLTLNEGYELKEHEGIQTIEAK